MPNVKESGLPALQRLVEQYRREHKTSAVNLREVAAWAIRKGGWEVRRSSAVNILARDLAHAMREEYFTDPQGRRVRKKHAQKLPKQVIEEKLVQLVLWHDVTEAKRPEMQAAFQQRRQGIVMDCSKLSQDVDSYNDNYNSSVPIKLLFDITEDLEDLKHGRGDVDDDSIE
jgi:hypothetical protein